MIVGWKSPLDGRVYGLEEFEPLGRVIPEPVLRAMARKVVMDTRHSGPNITITSGLNCPRKTLITRAMPIAPDPTKMWKMQRGTWLHEVIGLSLADNEDWITEEADPDACTFEGEIFGIKMSCRIDARRKDFTELIDWKFRGDGNERFIDPMGRAKDEDCAQLNMARILMEQATNKDLSDMRMYVWVMAGQTVRTTVPFMTEEQIGNIKPGGGDYSVKEIFKMLDLVMRGWVSEALKLSCEPEAVPQESIAKLVHSLPMVGEKMYRSPRAPSRNMCTQYCEVQPECYSCEGGI